MIQQGLNQLLTQSAYFLQPIGEKRRDEKAFKMAQQEAEKRENTILEQFEETQKLGHQVSDEQLEYAHNLYANRAKAQFERDPNQQNLQNWTQAIYSKEAMMESIAEERFVKQSEQKIRQEIAYEKLRKEIREKEGLTD